jgi:hypothetical protein
LYNIKFGFLRDEKHLLTQSQLSSTYINSGRVGIFRTRIDINAEKQVKRVLVQIGHELVGVGSGVLEMGRIEQWPAVELAFHERQKLHITVSLNMSF